MQCDTCKRGCASVMRVVVAKAYDRSLARPIFNCPECFKKKEQAKPYRKKGSTDSESSRTNT